MPRVRTPSAPGAFPAGYSTLEMVVVLVIFSVVVGAALQGYRAVSRDAVPRRTAEIFARDLQLARGAAMRERQSVVIRFLPGELTYFVETAAGREVVRRRYGGGGELSLTGIALDLPGDTIAFDPRGVADLFGASSRLAVARFEVGPTVYWVRFNSLGASRIERR